MISKCSVCLVLPWEPPCCRVTLVARLSDRKALKLPVSLEIKNPLSLLKVTPQAPPTLLQSLPVRPAGPPHAAACNAVVGTVGGMPSAGLQSALVLSPLILRVTQALLIDVWCMESESPRGDGAEGSPEGGNATCLLVLGWVGLLNRIGASGHFTRCVQFDFSQEETS